MPLISHIVDNLYVGGCIHGVDLGDFFSHIFSFYDYEVYQFADGVVQQSWRMQDGSHVDVDTLEEVVPQIDHALATGGRVLVHCQAGINRSNLVAAMVLRTKYRMSSDEAIAELRERRGDLVLANSTFENYLRSLDETETESYSVSQWSSGA